MNQKTVRHLGKDVPQDQWERTNELLRSRGTEPQPPVDDKALGAMLAKYGFGGAER